MDRLVYLDHAATTSARPEVVDAMMPYFTKEFGNPSSIYSFASKNKDVVEHSRGIIANALGADKEEIYFTGSGSEADNWALIASAEAYGDKGRHIITSKIEHHAILNTCKYLEQKGYEITYLNVDEKGLVNLEELESAIRCDTILVSIMFANNEIGTIEPVAEIGRIAHAHGTLFHTDAVQAFGQVPINVQEMNIDMLSASGHKFNGPKGTGFLYMKKGLLLKSFIHGGHQERGMRAGTENVSGIAGIGKAAEIAVATMDERIKKETMLRDYLINRLMKEIPYIRVNGHESKRLPNNVNVSFQFADGESILIMLDIAGICASSGSACTAGSSAPSHVLTAIGLPYEIARSAIRMTLGYENTKEEMDYTADNIKQIIENLRNMSPLYQEFMQPVEKHFQS